MPPVIAYVATVFTAVGFSAAVATWIATLVVNGALMFAAQKIMGKKADLSSMMGDVSDRQQMVRQAVAPRRLIYGKAKVSGPLAYISETGTNREYLHMVVMFASHECEGITKYFMNDEELTVDPSTGNVTSPARYSGFIRIREKLGTVSQTAYSELVTESGGEWNSNCKLSEIATIYVRIKYDTNVFPAGLPNFAVEAKGKKCLDPRTLVTAWTDNPSVCIYDYMRDTRYGLGAADVDFDSATLIASANTCDEDVDLAVGGTEHRYSLNGTVTTDQRPADVLDGFLSSMIGKLVFAGGKWYLHAGAYDTPTIELGENDLRDRIQVTTKLSRRELANGVKGTHVDATTWQPVDLVAQVNSLYLSEDGGERLWTDIQLPFTLSPSMAQRIAKVQLERGRQMLTVRMPCKLTALKVQCGRNIMITNARFGWTQKVFEVTSFILVSYQDAKGNPAVGVDLVCRETASEVWDWNDGMETTVDPAPNTNLPNPLTISPPTSLVLTSGSTTTIQKDGATMPRLLAEWTLPADQWVQSGGRIRIQYKTVAAPDWSEWNTVDGQQAFEFITDVVIGTQYYVRVRAENVYGVATAWVTSGAHTVLGDTAAPAAPTGLASITGTGKSVSLDWSDNPETDLGEYAVHRNTTNNFATATKIAEVRASRFVDVDVTIGTTYYYWITAIDRSENVSDPSTGVSATPGVVSAGDIDLSAPSVPSAPSLSSSGSYLSGDGTVLSRLNINVPAMPAGATIINVLYRGAGQSGWIVADQRTSGGSVSSIDDLTPGSSYDVAVQAFTHFGVGSSVVTASGSPFTAPNTSSGPNTPTDLYAEVMTGRGVTVGWTAVSDTNIAYYELWRNTSNTLVGANLWGRTTATRFTDTYVGYGVTYYYFVRAVNRSGVAGSYTSSVNATPTELITDDVSSGAITTLTSSYISDPIDCTAGVVVNDLTIGTTGEPVEIIAQVQGVGGTTMSIYRNSSFIADLSAPIGAFIDPVGPGTYTYEVFISVAANATRRFLSCKESKR